MLSQVHQALLGSMMPSWERTSRGLVRVRKCIAVSQLVGDSPVIERPILDGGSKVPVPAGYSSVLGIGPVIEAKGRPVDRDEKGR